jgi:Ca2+-binding RTX toxin-like protein
VLTDPISQTHLVLAPQASTTPGETHAALVVSQASFTDVRFSAGFQTIEQLRTGSAPNPWECAWAVFNYTDNTHFYYVAFKPNGWELGKADPAYPGAQRFLATGALPACAVGTEHSFDIQTDGNVIKVWLDGALLTTFTDTENPYLSGKVGFYTEDAKVAFDNVSGSITDNFEGYSAQTFSDGATLGSLWETPFVGYGFGAIQSDGTTSAAPVAEAPPPSDLFDLWLSGGSTRTVTGTGGNDRLAGSRHNDLIDGGGGSDRMTGRGGDDTYMVNSTGDRIVERNWEGIDTVLSTASSHSLDPYVENLTLTGTSAQTGVGNSLDNILTSNDVAGILQGGDGHDLLVSGKGADLLTGGAHSDTFIFRDAATATGGVRHITDFQPGVDKIDLHHLFAGYAGGDPLADGHLVLAPNAQGGTDILVDKDGSGSSAAVLVTAVDGVAASDIDVHEELFWY